MADFPCLPSLGEHCGNCHRCTPPEQASSERPYQPSMVELIDAASKITESVDDTVIRLERVRMLLERPADEKGQSDALTQSEPATHDMASDLREPDYTLLAKRSSDETLERLGREHKDAANQAFENWLMHEAICSAISVEQSSRLLGKANSATEGP